MVGTSEIKKGLCIRYNHGIYTIIDFQHVKPGKGPAFIRTTLRNVETGKVIDNTFTSGHKLDDVRVERRTYQFLYKEDTTYHFMNNENFEQTFVDEKIINAPKFLKEGNTAEIVFDADNESALICELPASIVLEITYTEKGEKGNTATNAFKPATVETGARVRVPPFIEIGQVVKINTDTGEYLGKA